MRKSIILFLLVVFCTSASAATFTVGGISYVTLSASEVSVTSNGYSGSVTIPPTVSYGGTTYKVTAISSSAFNNCANLISVTIGSNVATIESGAFAYSKSLSSVSIPNSVKKIGNQAFANCKALTKITLPSSLTSLGGQAFLDCSNLVSVSLPSSLTSIAFGTFQGCKSLTSITIPNSMTDIGNYAFYDCTALKTVYYLSTNPIGINASAFGSNVYNAATLIVASGKGSYVGSLSGWKNFSSIKEEEKGLNIGDEFVANGIRYRVTGNSSVSVIANTEGYSGYVAIPSSVKYGSYTLNVQAIAEKAFFGCTGLTSVFIPSSVTSIGHEAFAFCSGLSSIRVDTSNPKYDSRDNSNCIIEKSTNTLIQGCKESIIPVSVTSIGDAAFYGHTELVYISIPGTVKSLGWAAFATCTKLEGITIKKSITNIGRECFAFCESMRYIVVEEGNPKYDSRGNCNAIVETASNTLVHGCKTSTIPSSVRAIGAYAFRGISGLREIDIPYTVKSIGDYAFSMCDGLTKVRYLTTAPFSINANCFSGSSDSSNPYNNATLVVRRGYLYDINFVAGWKNFKNIVEDNTVFEDVNRDGYVNTTDVVSVYNYILGKDASGLSEHRADVNWDESVNTGDVVHLYNYIINVGGGTSTTKSYTFTVNGVSFTMILVEGDTFQMGATPEQQNPNDNEKPVHSVTLSTFSIGETEVTQALWKAVMDSNPSRFKGDNLPVERVSWDDCQKFIINLNQLTGRKFRLPTEAEWEFAARGGNKSQGYIYSGSNTLGNVAWYDGNSGYETHPVATKSPNELGIYDMTGNVWELCQDWYGSYSSSAQTNPTGPTSGYLRVNRGGSWNYIAWWCRTACRNNIMPDDSYHGIGLRLVLSE